MFGSPPNTAAPPNTKYGLAHIFFSAGSGAFYVKTKGLITGNNTDRNTFHLFFVLSLHLSFLLAFFPSFVLSFIFFSVLVPHSFFFAGLQSCASLQGASAIWPAQAAQPMEYSFISFSLHFLLAYVVFQLYQDLPMLHFKVSWAFPEPRMLQLVEILTLSRSCDVGVSYYKSRFRQFLFFFNVRELRALQHASFLVV